MLKIFNGRFAGPTPHIAIASGLIVLFVALTIGVVVIRFGASANKYEAALNTEPSTFLASQTRTSLYDILNAVRIYNATPTSAGYTTAARFGTQLAAELGQLRQLSGRSGAERSAVQAAEAAAAPVDAALIAIRGANSARGRAAPTDRLAA